MSGASHSPSIPSAETGIDEEKNRKISKKALVNKLNLVNFEDDCIIVSLSHPTTKRRLIVSARPEPCLGEEVFCLWSDPERIPANVNSFMLDHFFLDDGHKLICAKAELVEIDGHGIRLSLPEHSYEISSRKAKRYICTHIQAQIIQNSASFFGSLIDFSVSSFSVEIATGSNNLNWISSELPVSVILSDANETLYAGECKILKQLDGTASKTFVLSPLSSQTQRFRPKQYRSKRHQLIPSPNIQFKHPLTHKFVDLKVLDISGCGLSVKESSSNATLLPGMMIPQLEINFSNTYSIRCRAQVIYRSCPDASEEKDVKCGLAILDMQLQDHSNLLAILHQAADRDTYVCNKVDTEKLWRFFFETGFIYPKKYAHIRNNRSHFQKMYKKLYDNPEIARHFLYQKRGTVLGHLAMIRFYDYSWLVHHHAANKLESAKAGIAVLDQINQSFNDSHNLHSTRMNHIFCYFRPDNKFPSRVFGGFSRNLKQPKGCSVDTFAYLHYRRDIPVQWCLTGQWTMTKSDGDDLVELNNFYEQESGGQLITAFDLEPHNAQSIEICTTYENLGFQREKYLFSIKKDGLLKAVVLVNLSDAGLNMSELTSCIKVIILDADDFHRDTLNLFLLFISTKLAKNEIPVLLYPVSYAQRQEISYEKLYSLWILNMKHLDPYLRFCDTLFRRIH